MFNNEKSLVMELFKPAQFAKQIGITRQAISKAIKNEMLPVVIENGKKYINTGDPIVREYAENIKSVREDKQKSTKPEKPVKVKVKKKIGKSDPVEEEIPEYLKEISDSGQLTFSHIQTLSKIEMDKIKIYEDIKQKRQKRLQERKDLISIKFIKLVFGKIYDIHVNEFMAVKTRIKPELAKVFKTNDDVVLLEAEKAFDGELWDVLRRVKYEFDNFLKKHDK
jgi:hypothetical protein